MAAWLLNDLMSGPEIPTKTDSTVSPVIRSASVTLCRIDFTVASTFTHGPPPHPLRRALPHPRISTPSFVLLPRTVVTWLDPTSSPQSPDRSFRIHSLPGRMKTRPSVLRSAIPKTVSSPIFWHGCLDPADRLLDVYRATLSCSPASRVTTV